MILLTENRLATISFCGSYAGPVLGYALGGFLVEKYGAYGLLSPFYVSCTLNFVWLGIFLLSVGVNCIYNNGTYIIPVHMYCPCKRLTILLHRIRLFSKKNGTISRDQLETR